MNLCTLISLHWKCQLIFKRPTNFRIASCSWLAAKYCCQSALSRRETYFVC